MRGIELHLFKKYEKLLAFLCKTTTDEMTES